MVRARNRVGAPLPRAGLGVVRVEESADAELAARDAGHHLVLHDERRRCLAVALRILRDLGVPEQVAAARVNRHQVGVQRAHEQRVAEHGDAAVVAAAADPEIIGELVLVAPVHAARGRIDGRQVAGRLRDEHDAVDDERGGLRPIDHGNLIGPLQLQIADVAGIDLVEPAEALAAERAGVHQPVVGLFRRVEQPLPGHGRERRRRAGRRLLAARHLRAGGQGHDHRQTLHESALLPQREEVRDQVVHLGVRERAAGGRHRGRPDAVERP